jgi:hypothetical protein
MTDSPTTDEQPSPAGHPAFCRPEMFDQLGRAADLRSAEDQVLWTVFGAFWAANTVLLVALFATGKLPDRAYVGIIVSIVGVALCFAWHVVQNRTIGHLERFEKLMERLEKDLKIPSSYALSAKINTTDYNTYVAPRGPSARTVMRTCSALTGILWLLSFVLLLVYATLK